MSTASISYSSIKNAAGEARDVAKKLDKYADSINSTVYKKLNNYEGSWTSNITSARSKANAKISELRNEAGKYRSYANELDDLKTECESVDKAVRSKVSSLTASFKAAHGIKNSVVVNTISYFFTSVGNSSKTGRWLNEQEDRIDAGMDYIKQRIEDWYDYEGGKDFIKGLLVGVLEIAIAVVGVVLLFLGTITGVWAIIVAVATVVAAVIAVANGFANIVNECRALGYGADDPATAKRKSDLNTIQDTLRVETDSEFWHNFATGVDIVNIVCSVITVLDSAGKLLKNGYKWATGNIDELTDLRVKDILSKDGRGKFWSGFKGKIGSGLKDIGKALKTHDWRFFGDALLDFKTDFLSNLKNRYTFKADNLKVNLKTGKNIMDIGKVLAKDGFDIGKLVEKIVVPCINVAGITTLTFPEGGGQGQFDFSNITLKDIVDLKDFKEKIWDKGSELFDGGNIDSSVLEKINTPAEINVSIPEIHIPEINIPIVRAA